jgi:hypothetical protein
MRIRGWRLLVVVPLVALAFSVSAAKEDEPVVVFTGATVETAGKTGRIENATLVLRGNKIEAVGADVKVPDGARVIDARGKTILPGIIDPFHPISIASSPDDAEPQPIVGRGRRGGGFARPAFAGGGFTRVADNFNPYDPSYRSLLRSGLTGLNLVTAGYGQSALMRVTPGRPDTMLANPDGFLFTGVSNDSNSLDVIRTALEAADRAKKGLPQAAQPAKPSTDEEPPATPPVGRRGGRRGGGAMPGRGGRGGGGYDMASLKLWELVYEGKAPLFVNATNAAAILHLLKIVEPYKDVKVVLDAPGPALYETVDRLPARSVRVIVRPGVSLKPNTRDRIDVAALLHQVGLEFAFAQSASRVDLLASQDFPLFSVAYTVKCGLPRKVAIEALTARPAALIGLDKTHGTIEPGKSADLLIFAGDPLDPGSHLREVLIQGRTVYED